MKVLVTGATGFIGSALIEYLANIQRLAVVGMVRLDNDCNISTNVEFRLGEVGSLNKLDINLSDINVVVHTAGRVHITNEGSSNSIENFRRMNTAGTLDLAMLAADSGVKRFVFLSSIKVNGETTRPGYPFTPCDVYVPDDAYGLSKYEAEQGLLALAKETGMEVVIIRPPLVYGPGVKANFASMMRWMSRSVPLPFGAIHNQRSLVALDNLVSFISLCVDCEKSPKAANQVFLISDGKDVSTTELLKKVGKALNHQFPKVMKPYLVPFPVSIMTFFAKVMGKEDLAIRLFSSLQVDSSKSQELLGWRPVVTMDEQLAKMIKIN